MLGTVIAKMKTRILIVTAAMLLGACETQPLAPPATEAARQEATATPQVEMVTTSTVEPNTTAPPTSTPTAPPAAPAPLDLSSDLETILQRMRASHETWGALWVQFEAMEFPPPGTDQVAHLARLQIWLRQPGEVLLLCGPMGDGNPDYIFISDGTRSLQADLRAGATHAGEVAPGPLGIFFPQVDGTQATFDCPPAGMAVNRVGALIFPADLANREGNYALVDEATVSGRRALTVEFTPAANNHIVDRLRIDALTGFVLHRVVLEETSANVWDVSEITVSRIVYDPEIDSALFRLAIPEGVYFQEGPEWTVTEEPFVRPE